MAITAVITAVNTAVNTASIVLAETAEATPGNPIIQLAPFLLIGLVFYFLIIRPQRKRQADQKALLNKLDIGDEVVTIGGFHGEIVGLDDDTVELEIATEVVVTIARSAVARTVSTNPVILDDEDFDDTTLDDPTFDDPTFDDPTFDDTGFDEAAFEDNYESDAASDGDNDKDDGR